MESEFPSNSNVRKPSQRPTSKDIPDKKVEQVVTGKVIQRKKPLGKRIRETFTGADSKSVLTFVFFDVLIPAAKDAVADAVSQGVERKLFGEARSLSRRGRYGVGSAFGAATYNAYNRYTPSYSQRRPDPRATEIPSRRQQRAHPKFDEVILETRAEATEVIDQLFALIDTYEVATLVDFYEMVNIPSDYTDAKWGWTDIRGADVVRIREGYLLDLPNPGPID